MARENMMRGWLAWRMNTFAMKRVTEAIDRNRMSWALLKIKKEQEDRKVMERIEYRFKAAKPLVEKNHTHPIVKIIHHDYQKQQLEGEQKKKEFAKMIYRDYTAQKVNNEIKANLISEGRLN